MAFPAEDSCVPPEQLTSNQERLLFFILGKSLYTFLPQSANVYFPQQNWLLIYFCLPLNNVPKDKALFSARIGGADISCTGTKRLALFLARAFLSIVPFSVKLYFPALFSAAFFCVH